MYGAQLRRVSTLLAILLLAAASTTLAFETPEEAVHAYLNHWSRGEWALSAATIAPESLAEFKESVIQAAEGSPQGAAFIEFVFGPGVTLENAHEADATAAMARLFQVVAVLGRMNMNEWNIYGTVFEGPDMAHVVTRTHLTLMGIDMSTVEAVTTIRTPDGWRLLLTGDMRERLESLLAG